jgi:hypothetical protein
MQCVAEAVDAVLQKSLSRQQHRVDCTPTALSVLQVFIFGQYIPEYRLSRSSPSRITRR